jgi:pyruvate/2-oxoglutarate dehydrogenase complex dihydrolipoamide acyltransferase (E2) component
MILQLTVPAMAEDVEEIRILEWHGEPGRAFQSGELIVEFETYKALVEVRAAQAGILRRILVQPGDWVPIGGPVALFSEAADEAMSDQPAGAADMLIEFLVD